MIEFVSQNTVPQKIFVGDIFRLLYTFETDVPLLPQKTFHQEIDLSLLEMPTDTPDYSIAKMTLSKHSQNHNLYTLEMSVQAWSTGKIKLADFDLAEVIGKSDLSCQIIFSDENVSAITGANDAAVLEIGAPLLVPGTIYVVYALSFAALVLLAALTVALIKFRRVKIWAHKLFVRIAGLVNVLKTFYRLKKLATKNCSDADFCAELETTLRLYLSARYGVSFNSIVTSKIISTLVELTGGTLTEKKEMAAQMFVEIFYRCDHVRFAQNTFSYAPLDKTERSSLIKKAKNAVVLFEDLDKKGKQYD